jgi:hypothetical protein
LEPTSAKINCTNRMVNETVLEGVTIKAFNQILRSRQDFLYHLQENVSKTIVITDTLSPDDIQARLEELQQELIKKANNKQDYDDIADEIFLNSKNRKNNQNKTATAGKEPCTRSRSYRTSSPDRTPISRSSTWHWSESSSRTSKSTKISSLSNSSPASASI